MPIRRHVLAALLVATPALIFAQPRAQLARGLGLVQPRLEAGTVLYFYGEPRHDELLSAQPPADSLAFEQGTYYVEIGYAPPWFWPEVMILDYDALYLRAVTLTPNAIEVVVNTETGQTRWVDRWAVQFEPWPTFLLHVSSVEAPDEAGLAVFSGPGERTARVATTTDLLYPVAVRNAWLQVRRDLDSDRPLGWVRWHDGTRLLIRFSLVS